MGSSQLEKTNRQHCGCIRRFFDTSFSIALQGLFIKYDKGALLKSWYAMPVHVIWIFTKSNHNERRRYGYREKKWRNSVKPEEEAVRCDIADIFQH